jgi:hypothetical protein
LLPFSSRAQGKGKKKRILRRGSLNEVTPVLDHHDDGANVE